MSWAHYRGELTDLSPKTDDIYDGARASAMMLSVGDGSYFRVQLSGLKGGTTEVGAHLHVGPCGLDKDGAATVGVHYNTTPEGDPLVVNSQTEVWLNFRVSADGTARDTANVQFVPTPGPAGAARSITFHQTTTVPDGLGVGTAGAKLACVPFKIKSYSR